MKTRGTRGGIILSLSKQDSPESVKQALQQNKELLGGKVFVELGERISWDVIDAVQQSLLELGSKLTELRPPGTRQLGTRPPSAVPQAKGETVILVRTVRSGARVESTGSVIILGDVNAGAEIIAEDNIIVLGVLRGTAHAGAGGNEKAVIWAQQIKAKQLRIGAALAQADESETETGEPEIAQLVSGQIVLKPWRT